VALNRYTVQVHTRRAGNALSTTTINFLMRASTEHGRLYCKSETDYMIFRNGYARGVAFCCPVRLCGSG